MWIFFPSRHSAVSCSDFPLRMTKGLSLHEDVIRKVLAIVGSAVFLVIAPGFVAGLVPWWISHWRHSDHAGGHWSLLGSAEIAQLGRDSLAIADQEEEGLVGAGVFAGDGIDLVEDDGGYALGEGLKLAQRQPLSPVPRNRTGRRTDGCGAGDRRLELSSVASGRSNSRTPILL